MFRDQALRAVALSSPGSTVKVRSDKDGSSAEDGNTYPVIDVEISSTHLFYTAGSAHRWTPLVVARSSTAATRLRGRSGGAVSAFCPTTCSRKRREPRGGRPQGEHRIARAAPTRRRPAPHARSRAASISPNGRRPSTRERRPRPGTNVRPARRAVARKLPRYLVSPRGPARGRPPRAARGLWGRCGTLAWLDSRVAACSRRTPWSRRLRTSRRIQRICHDAGRNPNDRGLGRRRTKAWARLASTPSTRKRNPLNRTGAASSRVTSSLLLPSAAAADPGSAGVSTCRGPWGGWGCGWATRCSFLWSSSPGLTGCSPAPACVSVHQISDGSRADPRADKPSSSGNVRGSARATRPAVAIASDPALSGRRRAHRVQRQYLQCALALR